MSMPEVSLRVKTTKKLIFISAMIPSSLFALGAGGTPTNLTEFVNNFMTILSGDIANGKPGVLMFVAGFGFFGILTGVLKYVGAGADEERLGKAKQLIVYGLLGNLILYSFWGLASLLAKSYLGV